MPKISDVELEIQEAMKFGITSYKTKETDEEKSEQFEESNLNFLKYMASSNKNKKRKDAMRYLTQALNLQKSKKLHLIEYCANTNNFKIIEV